MQIQTRPLPPLPTASTAGPVGATSAPSDAVSTKSPAETALAEIVKKNQEAAGALSRLSQSARSDKEAAADAAKKKLEALRERLKTLMMMGGDPKAVAKEAAQIAKEIGQAAKDYAKAGGGAAAAGAGAAASASSATQAAGAAGGQTSGDATAVADPSTPLGADASGAPEGAQAGAAENSVAKAGEVSAQDGGAAGLGGGQSDDPVVKAARKLAQTAKELFTSASQQAQRQHKTGDLNEDFKKIAEADNDINDAGRALGGGGSSAYLAGGGAAEDPAFATISITA